MGFGESDAPEPVVPAERYVRGAVIGEGGMGRVVVAHDQWLRRDVALKEAALDAPDAAMLLHEAAIAARLDHPGIVPVHDLGWLPDGTPYFTMRVVRGSSLAHRLAGQRPAPHTSLRWLLAAAEAVGWAHTMGIVHRDLKPANIVVGEFGETQVIDWGLARDLALPDARRAAGTPGYMAPELAAGGEALPTSDVWSLGVILREVVATPLDQGPAEVLAIAARATATDPGGRYPDAKAFARDLAHYLDGRRVEAHRYSGLELAKRLVRAWRAPLIVAAIALVAITIGVVVAFRATEDALAASDRALARALTDEARARLSDGAWPEAEMLATLALLRGPSVGARGVLLATTAKARPTLLSEVAIAPGCDDALPRPDGRIACRTMLSRPLRWLGRERGLRWDAGYVGPFVGPTLVGDEADAVVVCADGHAAVAVDEPRSRSIVICVDGAMHALGFDGLVSALGRVAGPRVSAAAVAPDGLVVGHVDGRLTRVDLTGRVLATVGSGANRVDAIDVSPDGGVAAVVGDRGGVRIWDLASGVIGMRLPERWSGHVRFADDAARDLWVVGPTLRRWRLPPGAVHERVFAEAVTGLASDDQGLVVATSDAVHDQLDNWSQPFAGGAVIKGVASDGRQVIAVSAGVTPLGAWHRDTGHDARSIAASPLTQARRVGVLGGWWLTLPYVGGVGAFPAGAEGVGLWPDARFVDLTIDGSSAWVLRESPRMACRITIEDLPRMTTCFPVDGATAIASDGPTVYALDGRGVVAYDALREAPQAVFVARADAPELVEVAVVDGLVVAGDRAGGTWVWSRDGELVAEVRDQAARVSALVAVGRTIYAGSWDGSVRARDLAALEVEPAALLPALERAWGLSAADFIGD